MHNNHHRSLGPGPSIRLIGYNFSVEGYIWRTNPKRRGYGRRETKLRLLSFSINQSGMEALSFSVQFLDINNRVSPKRYSDDPRPLASPIPLFSDGVLCLTLTPLA